MIFTMFVIPQEMAWGILKASWDFILMVFKTLWPFWVAVAIVAVFKIIKNRFKK